MILKENEKEDLIFEVMEGIVMMQERQKDGDNEMEILRKGDVLIIEEVINNDV